LKGKSQFTKLEADEIRHLLSYLMRIRGTDDAKRVRRRLRMLHFNIQDFKVGLSQADFEQLIADGRIIIQGGNPSTTATFPQPSGVLLTEKRANSDDEAYVIDLCDDLLGRPASRQHRFDFLRGDIRSGSTQGQGAQLPVDAYYQDLALVVEYHERQHNENVAFFDKPDRLTVSGVHRGEQRRRYDDRRREVLPQHGIALVVFSFADFGYDGRKRLLRQPLNDRQIIHSRLARWVK
jgi:hypothetical protein